MATDMQASNDNLNVFIVNVKETVDSKNLNEVIKSVLTSLKSSNSAALMALTGRQGVASFDELISL